MNHLRKKYFQGEYLISSSDDDLLEDLLRGMNGLTVIRRDEQDMVLSIKAGSPTAILAALFDRISEHDLEIHNFRAVNTLADILRSMAEEGS